MANHFFEEVEVKVTPNFIPAPNLAQIQFQTTIWSTVYRDPNERIDNDKEDSNFILKMLIKLPYPENRNILMTGSFLVVGAFKVAKEFGKNDLDKALLVKSTGGSMVYGAAREFILQITARCNWDNRPLYIPTFPMDSIANCPPIESIIYKVEEKNLESES